MGYRISPRGGVQTVADSAARLALTAPDGMVVVQLDTNTLYIYDLPTTSWVAVSGGGGSSILTTKGDLATYSNEDVRLPVGADGQIILADSAQASGIKWADQPIPAHNDTTSIQGGTTDEYYHLTENQLNLVTGINDFASPSRLSASISVIDNGDLTVTSGDTFVTLHDTITYPWSIMASNTTGITSSTLTVGQKYLLVADYNSGSPIQAVRPLASSGVNGQTVIALGMITVGIGEDCYWLDFGAIGVNTANKVVNRLSRVDGLLVKSSGGIVSSSAGRYLQVTAGSYEFGLNGKNVDALDTTGTDVFSMIYGDSTAGFTEVTSQTQINNTQYWDSGTNTLTSLSANLYAVRWVFQLVNKASLAAANVVYCPAPIQT